MATTSGGCERANMAPPNSSPSRSILLRSKTSCDSCLPQSCDQPAMSGTAKILTVDDVARLRELNRQRAAAERARTNLARYFSPNLVEMLAERDEPLGAVRRQTVAVLFVDIVGCTQMAERMAPEEVVTMLRQFHDRMTAQIFACGGTLEKYIGDELLGVFGLPEVGPEGDANEVR